MAGHYQTGVKIAAGDLLIAHPHWNPTRSVVLITEANRNLITGLVLNNPSPMKMPGLVAQYDLEWYEDPSVYTGGDVSPGALILLHDSNWYSTNTLPVRSDLAISSDQFMLEKFSMGNTPQQWRVLLGCTVWDKDDLVHNLSLKKSQWLLLPNADSHLIFADPESQYRTALSAHSLYLTELHFG